MLPCCNLCVQVVLFNACLLCTPGVLNVLLCVHGVFQCLFVMSFWCSLVILCCALGVLWCFCVMCFWCFSMAPCYVLLLFFDASLLHALVAFCWLDTFLTSWGSLSPPCYVLLVFLFLFQIGITPLLFFVQVWKKIFLCRCGRRFFCVGVEEDFFVVSFSITSFKVIFCVFILVKKKSMSLCVLPLYFLLPFYFTRWVLILILISCFNFTMHFFSFVYVLIFLFSSYFLHSILTISAPFNRPKQQIWIPFKYWDFSICWNVNLQIYQNDFFLVLVPKMFLEQLVRDIFFCLFNYLTFCIMCKTRTPLG
jgi:hypothetical protein